MPKIGTTLTNYSDYIYLYTPTTDSLVLTEIPIVFPYEIKTNTPNFYHIEIVVVEIRYVCFFHMKQMDIHILPILSQNFEKSFLFIKTFLIFRIRSVRPKFILKCTDPQLIRMTKRMSLMQF